MITKSQTYVNSEGYLFLNKKRKLKVIKRIQKQIIKFGLTNEYLEELSI